MNSLAITAIFDLARPDNRVEYDIWLSSMDQRMLDFIEDFAEQDQLFEEDVLMTPHYKFYSCKVCDVFV